MKDLDAATQRWRLVHKPKKRGIDLVTPEVQLVFDVDQRGVKKGNPIVIIPEAIIFEQHDTAREISGKRTPPQAHQSRFEVLG